LESLLIHYEYGKKLVFQSKKVAALVLMAEQRKLCRTFVYRFVLIDIRTICVRA